MQDPDIEAHTAANQICIPDAELAHFAGLAPHEPHFHGLYRSLVDAGAISTSVAKPLIGQSSATLALLRQIEAVAPSDANVLITGESGTGKGVVAAELHRRSGRGDAALLAVDCASMPDALPWIQPLWSRGELPDALPCGTLVLDEVGELSPLWQARLLRFLQHRELAQAAGEECGVRLVATSSRDLSADRLAGRFRADLLFRLKVVSIALLPLRLHPEDIPALGTYFARSFALTSGRPGGALTPEAVTLLQSHDWPGNVRELENVIYNAVLVQNGGPIGPDIVALAAGRGKTAMPSDGICTVPTVGRTIEAVEKDMILDTLQRCGGRRAEAAGVLGISVRTLRNKLHDYERDGTRTAPSCFAAAG
jgi:two-component system response regulator FlrC